jgi:hypothetical protein
MTNRKSFWREPMVWLVFGLPLASIVAGVTLVVIAVRSGGADTVSDQVQRVAQVQTADLGMDNVASQRKLSAVLRAQDGVIEVLPATGDFDRTQPLRLVLAHPSQASADLHIELAPSALGWRADAPLDSSHDWSLQLLPIDSSWRLRGRLLKRQQAARLAPAVAGR